LGAHQSADRLWACYQTTRSAAKDLFVGPLWGLIDLGDNRAADALVELLDDQREYYEKYGFVSRVGDHRVVLPLVFELLRGVEEIKPDVMWALTGVAHRLGRDVLHQQMTGDSDAQESHSGNVELLIDRLFQYSQGDVERHFETFYTKDAGSLLALAKGQSLIA